MPSQRHTHSPFLSCPAQELTEEERRDAFKRTLARMKKVGKAAWHPRGCCPVLLCCPRGGTRRRALGLVHPTVSAWLPDA